MNLFEAVDNATVSISVSTSSQSIQIPNYAGVNQLRIYNAASATVFVRFGGSGVAASATGDIPIASGYTGGFSVPSTGSGTLYVAAIAPSGTGSIFFTPGEGI